MSLLRRRIPIVFAGALVAALFPAGTATAAPIVSMTRLPVPTGTTSSLVSDLNASGVSAGTVTVNGVNQAVRWSGSGYSLLSTPAANSGSSAGRINDAGTIAGVLSEPGLSNAVVRRWLPGGATSDCTPTNSVGVLGINARGETLDSTFISLHNFSADICHTDGTTVATGLSGANELADDDRVAGYNLTGAIQDGTFAFTPVVRAADGTVTRLPVPAGKSGQANAFGPGGEVVGTIGSWQLSSFTFPIYIPERAVVWQNGQLRQLATLGGATSGAGSVSRTGDIIGHSQTSSGQDHAALWRQGRIIDLGTLGGPSSAPSAVNNLGQVVGVSTTKSGASHAFLWSGGRMIDLGAPAGDISSAVDINDAGQIVGIAGPPDYSSYQAVRWTVRGA